MEIGKQIKRFRTESGLSQEILAFTEGKTLNTNEKNQELGKRPY